MPAIHFALQLSFFKGFSCLKRHTSVLYWWSVFDIRTRRGWESSYTLKILQKIPWCSPEFVTREHKVLEIPERLQRLDTNVCLRSCAAVYQPLKTVTCTLVHRLVVVPWASTNAARTHTPSLQNRNSTAKAVRPNGSPQVRQQPHIFNTFVGRNQFLIFNIVKAQNTYPIQLAFNRIWRVNVPVGLWALLLIACAVTEGSREGGTQVIRVGFIINGAEDQTRLIT